MTKTNDKEVEMGDEHAIKIDKQRSIERSSKKKQLGAILIVLVVVIVTLVLCLTLIGGDKDEKKSDVLDNSFSSPSIDSVYAKLGETCGGFDETTGGPFPSCGPGMKCRNTAEISIPGAGNTCVMDDGVMDDEEAGINDNNGSLYANFGETCEGFDETTGKPYPKCGPGMFCKPNSEASIPGSGSKCAMQDTSSNNSGGQFVEFALLNEKCEGFDETTGRPYPSCGPGMKCEASSGGFGIPGSGKKCVMDENNNGSSPIEDYGEYAKLGEKCKGFDQFAAGKPLPICGPGMVCEVSFPSADYVCMDSSISENGKYAKLGEACEGFDETTGGPFPSCGPGMVCKHSGFISIPGAGKECVMDDRNSGIRKRNLEDFADVGETCEGFDESTGTSFPSCREGLLCENTSEITIPGAGKKCVMDDSTRRKKRNLQEEFADLGEACGGFDELTGQSFPNCKEGLVCEESAEVSIPGAGGACSQPSDYWE